MAMVGGRAFRELKGSRMAAKMAKPLSGVNMLNKGTVVIGSVVAASTGFLWTAISTDSKCAIPSNA